MAEKNIPYEYSAAEAAVLVIDMQNDFVREGAPMSLQSCRDAVPNVGKIIEAGRTAGLPIIYLRFFTGPKETLVWTWSPQQFPPVKCCWKNVKRSYDDRDGEP